jgi:hypothetical protein
MLVPTMASAPFFKKTLRVIDIICAPLKTAVYFIFKAHHEPGKLPVSPELPKNPKLDPKIGNDCQHPWFSFSAIFANFGMNGNPLNPW